MQDESNLFFSHQGRKFRVETNNIVLQYSRGYPSMTALNAAFNDSEEETKTISKINLLFRLCTKTISEINLVFRL